MGGSPNAAEAFIPPFRTVANRMPLKKVNCLPTLGYWLEAIPLKRLWALAAPTRTEKTEQNN